MKLSMAAYWAVLKKRIADYLPHEIKFSLQEALLEGIHDDLLTQTASDSFNLECLMEEDTVLAYKRKRLNESIERLRKAVATLFDSMDKMPGN